MTRVTRTRAFVRGEFVSTLRQPRLLLALVVGPFLILFLFGLGYRHALPQLATVVVGRDSGELTRRVDEYIRREEPAGIDYQGTTRDEDAALETLRAGAIDLVVVLPDRPLDTLGKNERAAIEIHHRSLDPITSNQLSIAAASAIARINSFLLAQAVAEAQDTTGGLDRDLGQAREQLDRVREAVDAGALAEVQANAGRLAPRLDRLADELEQAGQLPAPLGLTAALDDITATLRSGSQQLEELSDSGRLAQLDQAVTRLAEVDEALSRLREVRPEVAVQPFEAEIVSQTPVPVTLDRFYAPGLLALMIQHLGVTFAALALVRERQIGITEMLSVAPVTTSERLTGKTIAFLVLGGAITVALTGLIVIVFDVPLPASWIGYLALLAVTLLASIGLGFLAAALSTTGSQAVQYSMLLLLTAIFFAGLFMPLQRIDMPVELVSWMLPATHAFEGLQDLMLLGRQVRWWLLVGPSILALATLTSAGLLLNHRDRTG